LIKILSETKYPARALKIAGSVGILYMLVNIVYFAAVINKQLLEPGTVVAAAFFGNVFGKQAEKVMSVFVALLAFGKVLSVPFFSLKVKVCPILSMPNASLFGENAIFRCVVVQKLGREGVLPFSSLFAGGNRPFNSPAMGLFEHYIVFAIIMLVPPPGDAYNFLLR
jgi:hypothetical protein